MKPPIQIVDENDQVIGYKPRDQVDYSKDIYRSTTLWLENSKGEVLIAQRKLTKDKDPGKWGPAVAGTVDKDETYESNIYKEAKEEIGLEGVPLKIKSKIKLTSPRRNFISVFYAIADRGSADFKIQEAEVEQLAWMPKDELFLDIKIQPDKYVPSMMQLADLFKDS